MLSNYFTFHHIAQELNKRYTGAVIAEAYSQEKNTLSFVLYVPEPHTITISCVARRNFITARAGEFRAKKNSIDLFSSLINAHVQSIFIDAQDRIIYIKTSDDRFVLFEMFGARANVVLCSDDGTVVDAFLAKKELQHQQRTLQYNPVMLTTDTFLPGKEFFHTAFSAGEPAFKTLKNIIPKLGSLLVEEALFTAEIARDSFALLPPQIDTLYSAAKKIVEQLLKPTHEQTPAVYFEENTPIAFSIIPLKQYSALTVEFYKDIFTGLQKFLSYGKSAESFALQKKQIIHWLEQEHSKTERTITAVEKELAESSRAEEYELFGKLLTAHLHAMTKGMKSIAVKNSFSNNEDITIHLDASLTPAKNAERYFEKAKKSKAAREETLERLTTLKKRFQTLTALRENVREVDDSISLKNFLHFNSAILHTLGYMTKKEQEELPPFKIFTVDGGFTVYAGKSSDNNDLLTVKFAKPNDLWFHARGSSGSHVVLKMGTGNGTPSKKAIEQAAAIAAYYSKMKNARNVPVAMTEKKYVRKPKGVPAGTVVIEKEKVIFVMPALPGGES